VFSKKRQQAIQTAFGEYGINEYAGLEHNKRILQYFADIGHRWVRTDETAWCSTFVNWVCLQCELPKSGALDARSWMLVGDTVSFDTVCMMDIVVLWRVSRDDWRGHVGFYVQHRDHYIYLLGGNQDNRVCIKHYPQDRLLSVRRVIHD
jgi:uncharacterized protein (TIGR02594 family)